MTTNPMFRNLINGVLVLASVLAGFAAGTVAGNLLHLVGDLPVWPFPIAGVLASTLLYCAAYDRVLGETGGEL